MSEKEPYTNDEWAGIPLPDGDAAWGKMELLLDKEDRRRAVPFWFWRYAGLGLLFIGLTAAGWLLTAGHEQKAEEAKVINEPLLPPAKQVTPLTKEVEKNTGYPEANMAAHPMPLQTPKAVAITNTADAKEEVPSSVAKKTGISGLKTLHSKRQSSSKGTKPAQLKPLPGPATEETTPVETSIDKEATNVSVTLLQKADSVQVKNLVQKDTTAVKDSAATQPPVVDSKKKSQPVA
ncbi:MAG TPA: hypothetical protein VM871_07505, partial [Flavisolibacter sp.]|nr:hypothetical protein [Flavisolibacter sp.]